MRKGCRNDYTEAFGPVYWGEAVKIGEPPFGGRGLKTHRICYKYLICIKLSQYVTKAMIVSYWIGSVKGALNQKVYFGIFCAYLFIFHGQNGSKGVVE